MDLEHKKNSKLFDWININMLSLKLNSKTFIHYLGNLILIKKQNSYKFIINH